MLCCGCCCWLLNFNTCLSSIAFTDFVIGFYVINCDFMPNGQTQNGRKEEPEKRRTNEEQRQNGGLRMKYDIANKQRYKMHFFVHDSKGIQTTGATQQWYEHIKQMFHLVLSTVLEFCVSFWKFLHLKTRFKSIWISLFVFIGFRVISPFRHS